MSASAPLLTGKNRRRGLQALIAAPLLALGIGANFPNGTQEIFGIGLDDSMWTDWGTEAHPSGWQQLSPALSDPFCDPSWGIVLSNNGDYGLEVECCDFNGKVRRYRADWGLAVPGRQQRGERVCPSGGF
jgi:hypothetical protein